EASPTRTVTRPARASTAAGGEERKRVFRESPRRKHYKTRDAHVVRIVQDVVSPTRAELAFGGDRRRAGEAEHLRVGAPRLARYQTFLRPNGAGARACSGNVRGAKRLRQSPCGRRRLPRTWSSRIAYVSAIWPPSRRTSVR